MKNLALFLSTLVLVNSMAGCTYLHCDGKNVVTLKHADKTCKSLGELSSNVGSVTTQLSYLKNLAAQKGANAIVVEEQKWRYNKQISGAAPSTVVTAYSCSGK